MNPPQAVSHLLVELCAGGIDDVILAAELHVDRIELNSGMAVGGLTPPAGLVAAARRIFPGPIVGMVRPREAGFAYSDAEFTQMLDDCEFLLAAGINGIAVGCLTWDGTIDVDRCMRLRRLFPAATLVFHKAFDATPDLHNTSQQLIDVGFDRILTSGGRTAAVDGSSRIRELQDVFGTQIEFIVAGGVRAHNLDSIVRVSGCHQIHTAARCVVSDPSTNANCSLDFGQIQSHGLSGYGVADRLQLQGLISVASQISRDSVRKETFA